MNLELKEAIWRGGFKPTEEASTFESALRAKLGLTNRYDSARLCIGRSLAERCAPESLRSDTTFGKAIAGEHLFGEDVNLWISVLVLDGNIGPNASIEDFRALVEAHWARGASLLRDEHEQCNGDESKFLSRIAEFLPEEGSTYISLGGLRAVEAGPIKIKVGSISKVYPEGESVELVLNGPGTSPHIALMGKVGSGKTTTGVQIAVQILEQSQIPVLMIDPKGEFVSDGKLTGRIAGIPMQVQPLEVGHTAIPLDFLPDPGIGEVSIQNASMQLRDSIVLCCKGAGNIQQDLLRTSIEKVIRYGNPRDLDAIKESYRAALDREGKQHDSIMSRLNELTSLACFSPDMTAADFFSRSWVISLKALGSEELKRLVVLLLLDALKAFIFPQSDAQVSNGYRSLRHLLIIDEARRILSEKKYQSLVDIVRQGRSKGCVVMLLSQDPSDFEGQADDFTTQLGTVVAFGCSQTQHGLKALQGVYGRKVQPGEFSDTYLPKGVAFAKLPGRVPERILCWE